MTKCIVAGCQNDDAEGELNTGMCDPHYQILTRHGRGMLTGNGKHSGAARVIANLIPNELAFYDADALLPKQTRLLLAQPLNRYPYSGTGRVNAMLNGFRSDAAPDDQGSIAAYMGIVDNRHFVANLGVSKVRFSPVCLTNSYLHLGGNETDDRRPNVMGAWSESR